MWWSAKPYVSAAQRRANALAEVDKLKKSGRTITPVVLEGKKIATTFWGKAWCDNLETYSDYESRLPRGRSYVRNGSVVDLQIGPGKVSALVSGSTLYDVTITITDLARECWTGIQSKCAGQIGSMIELLQGKLSTQVMEVITRPGEGLFPKPLEIKLRCSCPDGAYMCKHVAAVLYAVGARLDRQPELLFTLRQVDHLELLSRAGDFGAMTASGGDEKTISDDALADVFGIELEPLTESPPAILNLITKPGKGKRPAKQRQSEPKSRSPKKVEGKAARVSRKNAEKVMPPKKVEKKRQPPKRKPRVGAVLSAGNVSAKS